MSPSEGVAYRDWAWAYDAIYASRALDRAGEAREVLAVACEQLGREPGSWLDVACGTGAHLEELDDHVDEVVGVDRSPQMLAVARGRLPDAELVEADMRTLGLDRVFDVVSCLFSSIAHVGDVDALDTSIARMAAHLVVGGVLVVQPWITPEILKPEGVRDVVVAEVDGDPVTRVSSSRWDGRAVHLEMAYSTATPDGVRVATEQFRLPVWPRERHLGALTSAGLVDVEWLDGRDTLGRGLVVGRRVA